jgi:hypothetical protein
MMPLFVLFNDVFNTDIDYQSGGDLGGPLENTLDGAGANLDDVNCDYLGTCYDGQPRI